MKIYIGSDHAGFERKNQIVAHLKSQDQDVVDVGTSSTTSVDYPDYANLVCEKLNQESGAIGILICGSGQGVAMRANKFLHIRAALCWNLESAGLSREHNDANVLCLGSRFTDENLSNKIVDTFLITPFAGGRHTQRVVKVNSPV